MNKNRCLTKQEIREALFGILAMTNGFSELGNVGGERQEEMIYRLPHQIACRIMELQDLINNSQLLGDVAIAKCSCGEDEACSYCPKNKHKTLCPTI